jgi:hypothetical protein
MKVLIDECAPRALKGFLLKHGHESLTVGGAALKAIETSGVAFTLIEGHPPDSRVSDVPLK